MALPDPGIYCYFTPARNLTPAQVAQIQTSLAAMKAAGALRPDGAGYGLCGEGTEYQVNIEHYSKETITLFDVPKEGDADFHPKLAKLAHKINRKFHRKALRIVNRERKAKQDQSLEVTIHLASSGLRPILVRSLRRMRNAGATVNVAMAPPPSAPPAAEIKPVGRPPSVRAGLAAAADKPMK